MRPTSRLALSVAALLAWLPAAGPVSAQPPDAAADAPSAPVDAAPAADSADDLDTALGAPSRPAPVEETAGIEPEAVPGGFILPIEGDVFYAPNLKVLFSLPGDVPASLVLLVDGYPETSPLRISEGLVSAEIRGLKPGVHTLTLLLFNERTVITAKEETRFFVRVPEPLRKTAKGPLRQFGRVVGKMDWKGGEARGRILSQSELTAASDTTVTAGAAEEPVSQELEGVGEVSYSLKYKLAEANGKVLLRTDENRFRQPAHRFTGGAKYGPWVGVKAGDVYPSYNNLILNGTRLRGGEGTLGLVIGEKQYASLKVATGESRREVPAFVARYDTGNGGTRTDTVPGTFAQRIHAARLGFGGGPHFDLGLTYMKATDEVGSDDEVRLNNLLHGTRPLENFASGADLRVGIWDGKIQLYADWAFSLFTRDRSLGAFSAEEFDVAFDPADYQDFFTINSTTRGWQYLVKSSSSGTDTDVGGFINVNSAYNAGFVTSIPLSGFVTETEFRYSHLGLEYHTEGNPFLGGNPGDGFSLIQRLLVLDNRLSLALEFGNYDQDLGLASSVQRNIKAEIRFMPGPYQPSFVIGGGRTNIVPVGEYSHQFSSSFLSLNSGAYHQFTLPEGKLHASVVYAFTQDDSKFESELVPALSSTNRTNVVNAAGQYKPRRLGFMPKAGYTFTTNGFQQPLHNFNLGFIQTLSNNQVKIDATLYVGQYPESDTKNDISLGEGVTAHYQLTSNQTFRLRERWIQYGKRRNVLVGANYELFF